MSIAAPAPAHCLEIGSLALDTPILLAPMVNYTDLPFRLTARRLGGLGLAFTGMLSPKCLLAGSGKKRREMLATGPEDQPLGHQIYGTDPQLMREAARWLEEHGAVLIDINMGCPQNEISSAGAGAGLLRRPADAAAVAEAVAGAVSVPVTVKLRLGWDGESLVAASLARDLEMAGVAAITVHGRTRDQGYAGRASLDGIRRVVEAVDRIPVIGNGDIVSPETARRMLRETGCAGIMVGRGATANPWLIRDIWRDLQGLAPLSPPTLLERWHLLLEQFDRSVFHYGERHAVVLFRRWIPQRAGKLGLRRDQMVRLLQINGLADLRQALDEAAAA